MGIFDRYYGIDPENEPTAEPGKPVRPGAPGWRPWRRRKVPAPTAKRMVWLLLVALIAYFLIIGYRGLALLRESSIMLKVFGVAVLILPFIGIYLVIAELRFGVATEIMGQRLVEEGAEPEPELPISAGGRYVREAADALFAERKAAVEASPEDWRAWYRLSLAYDYSGDRKRAREAMRTAISHCDLTGHRQPGPGD